METDLESKNMHVQLLSDKLFCHYLPTLLHVSSRGAHIRLTSAAGGVEPIRGEVSTSDPGSQLPQFHIHQALLNHWY